MPLLMYCLASASAALKSSTTGVAEMPVCRREESGVAVFYSNSSSAEIWLHACLRDSALRFHRVTMEIFESAAIIPFRFPTVLENDLALAEHLACRAAEYKRELEKFANQVQMEVRISFVGESSGQVQSGADFLRGRQKKHQTLESLAEEVRVRTQEVTVDRRQRRFARGLNAFLLLDREHLQKFKDKVATIPIPRELEVRVSGPWPVTEFLESNSKQQ